MLRDLLMGRVVQRFHHPCLRLEATETRCLAHACRDLGGQHDGELTATRLPRIPRPLPVSATVGALERLAAILVTKHAAPLACLASVHG